VGHHLGTVADGSSNFSAGNQPWKAASVLILPSRVQPSGRALISHGEGIPIEYSSFPAALELVI
jgi:hypothetical protein